KTALGATRTVPHRHFQTIEEAVAAARSTPQPPPAPLRSAGGGVSQASLEGNAKGRVSQASLEGSVWKIAALEITSNSRSIFDLTPSDFPLALIIGNEITGVSDFALSLCDFTLEIPMLGAKHSLNVAVAYGVAAFECMRVQN